MDRMNARLDSLRTLGEVTQAMAAFHDAVVRPFIEVCERIKQITEAIFPSELPPSSSMPNQPFISYADNETFKPVNSQVCCPTEPEDRFTLAKSVEVCGLSKPSLEDREIRNRVLTLLNKLVEKLVMLGLEEEDESKAMKYFAAAKIIKFVIEEVEKGKLM